MAPPWAAKCVWGAPLRMIVGRPFNNDIGAPPWAAKCVWRPLGRPSVWGAPLTMIVGRPLSAPGAYLQFGDGTPLADNHYETSFSWGMGFYEMKLCAYLFYIQLLRCMLVQVLGKTKRIQRGLFWNPKSDQRQNPS